MKHGTTSIQNIEFDTVTKFRRAKKKYEFEHDKDMTNDQYLQELLK